MHNLFFNLLMCVHYIYNFLLLTYTSYEVSYSYEPVSCISGISLRSYILYDITRRTGRIKILSYDIYNVLRKVNNLDFNHQIK